jgi:hypothetical protein
MNAIQLRAIQLESRKLRDQLIDSPYAWPGGYPMFAVTSDGAALCHKCCKSEALQIGRPSGYSHDQWRVIGLDVNWEDSSLYCDHCGERIESAYAD